MDFSIDAVKTLVNIAYTHHARTAFGEAGTEGLATLLDLTRLVFQRVPPEGIQGTLTVAFGIGASPLRPILAGIGESETIPTHEDLGRLISANQGRRHTFVETFQDRSTRLLFMDVDIDLVEFSRNALIYRFESNTDRIFVNGIEYYIPKVSPALKSNFATPTLSSLDDALNRYAFEMALESQCKLLAQVWEGGVDGPRLILRNKPEHFMRDSLAQALHLLLRDTSVHPEHNTDETKPVDIKVEWFGSEASALIEVKWIGRSTSIPRSANGQLYLDWEAPRAQSGANQLADYMDREVRHAGNSAPRGYLVVFDARRRNVSGADVALSREDALFFENDEIVYNPDHSRSRRDFARPRRFFMRPRQSHFLPSANT